jgi:hypothetical protein
MDPADRSPPPWPAHTCVAAVGAQHAVPLRDCGNRLRGRAAPTWRTKRGALRCLSFIAGAGSPESRFSASDQGATRGLKRLPAPGCTRCLRGWDLASDGASHIWRKRQREMASSRMTTGYGCRMLLGRGPDLTVECLSEAEAPQLPRAEWGEAARVTAHAGSETSAPQHEPRDEDARCCN